MDPYDKEKSRRRRIAIRRILMSKWDPIGVRDEPMAADEYDGYIGDICALLDRDATDKEIIGYLFAVETDRMGLTDLKGNPVLVSDDRIATAAALQELKKPGAY